MVYRTVLVLAASAAALIPASADACGMYRGRSVSLVAAMERVEAEVVVQAEAVSPRDALVAALSGPSTAERTELAATVARVAETKPVADAPAEPAQKPQS